MSRPHRTLVLANVSPELCEAVGAWFVRYDREDAQICRDSESPEMTELAHEAAKLIRALNLDAVAKIALTEDL